MFNIMGNLKALGTMLVGILAFFGWWKYNNKVEENEELQSYADKRDKENNALEETVKVQEKVHKQEVANVEMEKEVSENDTKIANKRAKKSANMQSTVANAVEGEEFDLKA